MTTYFPERVWEGGSSRPATDSDHKRRRLLIELLASTTTEERKTEIRQLLEQVRG